MTKKKVAIVVVLIVLAVVFMFWPASQGLRKGEGMQTGFLEISHSEAYRHEVLFPKRFVSPPRIEISLTKGRGYLEIVESRSDGFVFKTSNLGYSVVNGAYVQWVATGILFEQKNGQED